MATANRSPLEMDLVRSGLILGGQTAEEAPIATVKAHGITHVLQLVTNCKSMMVLYCLAQWLWSEWLTLSLKDSGLPVISSLV